MGKQVCLKFAIHRGLVEQGLCLDDFQEMAAAKKMEISSNKLTNLQESSERFLRDEKLVGSPSGSGSQALTRTNSLAVAHATVASRSLGVDRPVSLQRGASYPGPTPHQQYRSAFEKVMTEPLVASSSAASMRQRTVSRSTSTAQHTDWRQLQLQASTSFGGYDDRSVGRSQEMSVAYGQAAFPSAFGDYDAESHELSMTSGQTTFSIHQHHPGGPTEAGHGAEAHAMGGGAMAYPYQPQPPQFQPGPSQPWSTPNNYAQTEVPQFQPGPSQTWSDSVTYTQTEVPQVQPGPSQHWSIPNPHAQTEIDPFRQLCQTGSSQIGYGENDFERGMRECQEALAREGWGAPKPVEIRYIQGSQPQPEFLPPHQPEFLPLPEDESPPSSVYYHRELVPTPAPLTRPGTLQTISWQSQGSSGSSSSQVQNSPTQHSGPNDSSSVAVPGQTRSTLGKEDFSWTVFVPGSGSASRIPSYHLPQPTETPNAPLAPTTGGGALTSAASQHSSEASASASSSIGPAGSSTSIGRQPERPAETPNQPRNSEGGSSEPGVGGMAAIPSRTYSPGYSSNSASTPNDSPSGASTASSDVGPDTPSDTVEEEAAAGKDGATSVQEFGGAWEH
ncbi:hypothetical protein DFH06DRAFT_48068 [Mycena polygramma]|nr:hypothetical protein DFH06DRAFT_48068 [Mycena polygramma]